MDDHSSATPERAEVPIDGSVVDRVADSEIPSEELAEVLTVLDAELRGLHSAFEREYDYVTVEGRRAYVVDAGEWESLVEGFELDSALVEVARRAHTEQTRLLVDAAVSDVPFGGDAVGVVVGVDTAEEIA